MQNEYKQVLRYGFGTLAVIAGLLLLLFINTSYSSFEKLFEVYRSERILVRNPHDYGFSLITYRTTIASLASLLTGFSWLFYRLQMLQTKTDHALLQNSPFKTLRFPFVQLHRQWLSFPRQEKIIFLGFAFFLIGVRFYLIDLFPVMIDEAATFVLFLHKGLVASVSYYPIPNNHILYTVLCLPFYWLIKDPFYALKLPSLLISLVLFPVMYLGLRSVLKFPAALVTGIGCSFSYYTLYYAVQGRGYTLLLFCTFIAGLAILKITQQKASSYWLIFILASIAGFYTIPVFLYPFGCMLFFATGYFLVTKKFQALLMLIIASAFITLSTILLYLPVILVSGADQLYGNEYVIRLPWEKLSQSLPFYLSYTQGAMLGQESVGAYLWLTGVSSLFLILLFHRKLRDIYHNSGLNPVIIIWVLSGALLPLPFILVQGVLPPERVWLFKLFADFLILGILFQIIVTSFFQKRAHLIRWATAGLLLLFSIYQINKLYRDTRLGMASNSLFEKNITEIGAYGNHKIFSNYAPYRFHLLYYFLTQEIPFIFDEFNARKNLDYNILILDRSQPIPSLFDLSRYYLKQQDPTVQVYFVKKPTIN